MRDILDIIKKASRATLTLFGILLLVFASSSGCSRPTSTQKYFSWSDLIRQLVDINRIARLDTAPTSIITSYDPTGGNNDFNHFVRKGPPGWVVLADLKGPGYVSRFWFTGAESGKHGLRFYFDEERNPRLDTTLGEFCGGKPPFLPPLANHEQYCWYSYVPIPYAKRLIIMSREGGYKPNGWPRLFYQINYSSLPKGQSVQTFPKQISDSDMALLASVRQSWQKGELFQLPKHIHPVRKCPVACHGVIHFFTNTGFNATYECGVSNGVHSSTNLFTLAPGVSHVLQAMDGPGIIRQFRVRLAYDDAVSADARDRMLRNVVLRINWNNAPEPSVEAPVGDFFGSFWHPTRFQSMYFGLSHNTFWCHFQMPFEASAQISFENQEMIPVTIETTVDWEPLSAWESGWGYFHAGWTKTSPDQVGQPHPILQVKGRGKYVGCILSVTSLDRSWWILEGDEIMFVDGNPDPFWHGTGLEDYFNGGWYYQNVLIRPLNGLLFKAFFRTIQYRIHLPDPVAFKSSFHMFFERGTDNASRGWMESVAFYYMDKPSPAFSRIGVPAERMPPPDPMAKATVMLELWNYERFDDYKSAGEFIDAYLGRYKDFSFASVLRLRQVAYKERLNGFESVRPVYENILATETNNAVLQFANTILWYHQNPSNALLGVYCNMRAKVFLDGREIGEAGDPKQMMVWRLQLRPGKHVLALQAQAKSYPNWVQACLRTHQGDVITVPDWKHAINPSGDWKNVNYDDSSWTEVGGTGVKGPPEEPYVWVVPDPFVDMQSKAIGLCPSLEWPNKRGTVVYRKTFEIR